MADKVTIEIPKASSKEIVQIPKGVLGDMKKKFEQLDKVVFGIMIAVVLSAIAIIVAVIGLFLDQMRFNSAAYKEYSDKNDVIVELQSTNQELLKTNKLLMDKLLELQKQEPSDVKQ